MKDGLEICNEKSSVWVAIGQLTIGCVLGYVFYAALNGII